MVFIVTYWFAFAWAMQGSAQASQLSENQLQISFYRFLLYIKELQKKLQVIYEWPVIIFAVHTSKMTEEDARILIENADIVWGCASKAAREIVAPKAIFQLQGPVPVFAMNFIGKKCMLARVLYCGDAMVTTKASLPVLLPPEIQPDPLL